MLRTVIHSKIHRATVTGTYIDYEGSITIDEYLLEQANIKPYEQVHVLNLSNNERFVTYVIKGEAHSGCIEVNGAAARSVQKNDLLIIINYCQLQEIPDLYQPKVVVVDTNNKIQ